MSSGGIFILPMAVVGVAAAAVVIAAVGAAVLLVNAAGAAAEGAVRAVGAFGEQLEQRIAAMRADEANVARWQCAAGDVVALNARIRLLEARAKGAGVHVDIPPPVDLAGCTVEEVMRRAAQAQQALQAAQREVDAVVEKADWAAMVATLPPATAQRSDTTAALEAYRETLASRYALAPSAAPATRDTTEDVKRLIAALDPDANAEERSTVLQGAARVSGNPNESGPYLRELRREVKKINSKVARRRLAAEWLTTLEGRSVSEALAENSPPAPLIGTAAKLRAVVEGDADLTPELRREGIALVEWAADIVRQRFTRDLVLRALREDGYDIDAGVDTQQTAGLRITRGDWQGEHSADVWVDRDGTVHGRVLRERDGAGDQADLRDRERCEDFTAHLTSIAARLDDGKGGVRVSVDRNHKPQRRNAASTPVDVEIDTTAPKARTREAGK